MLSEKSKDFFENETYKLVIRRNKTVAEHQVGVYRSHFHKGLEDMMATAEIKQYPLKMVNSNICCQYQDDFLELVTFRQQQSSTKFEVHSNMKNLQRIGLQEQLVNAMLAMASVAANKA